MKQNTRRMRSEAGRNYVIPPLAAPKRKSIKIRIAEALEPLEKDGVDVNKFVQFLLLWFPERPNTKHIRNSAERLGRFLKSLERQVDETPGPGVESARQEIRVRLELLKSFSRPQVRETETTVLHMASRALQDATGKMHHKELAQILTLVCEIRRIPYSIDSKALSGRLRKPFDLPLALRRHVPNLKKT